MRVCSATASGSASSRRCDYSPVACTANHFTRRWRVRSRYFNAHPYLAAVAVGALARAELDGEPPERIERFRTALCGPLGSVGDRLVWAGWLPFCSLASLAIFGLGGGTWQVVGFFLVLYNAGHFALRIWGLNTGWNHGLRVASALANPGASSRPATDRPPGGARHRRRHSTRVGPRDRPRAKSHGSRVDRRRARLTADRALARPHRRVAAFRSCSSRYSSSFR